MSETYKLPSPLRVDPQAVPRVGKSEQTRALIMNAALDFIWARPFCELTVSTLMMPTGVSRSAFYQYFDDLHEVMNALLDMLKGEIFEAAAPWVSGVGDPVALVRDSLGGLVRVGYERGPLIRAVSDASTTDTRIENAWVQFIGDFDDAATARIEADQAQGLIPKFEARPVAIALNRLDAYTLIEAFGQHPRGEPEPVREALGRIWVATLYGSQWVDPPSSDLRRT